MKTIHTYHWNGSGRAAHLSSLAFGMGILLPSSAGLNNDVNRVRFVPLFAGAGISIARLHRVILSVAVILFWPCLILTIVIAVTAENSNASDDASDILAWDWDSSFS